MYLITYNIINCINYSSILVNELIKKYLSAVISF